jgi:serine/threonine protein kinase
MDLIINNKYKLIEEIGKGSFGSIYKAENIRTGEYVAIKVEPITSQTKLLTNESRKYQYLSHLPGIPNIKWYGKDNMNYYMVINLLGDSLENFMQRTKSRFSLKMTLYIGIQITQLLKTIHERSLLHRDIKPDNFLFGPHNDKRQLYLIDFGFCKSYLISGNRHIEMKPTNGLIGSPTYASINAHDHCELSRKDDMESLGYTLLYLYLGKLKWQYEQSKENIRTMKTEVLCDDKIPHVLLDYFIYISKLGFKDEPDYEKIINDFRTEIDILV